MSKSDHFELKHLVQGFLLTLACDILSLSIDYCLKLASVFKVTSISFNETDYGFWNCHKCNPRSDSGGKGL